MLGAEARAVLCAGDEIMDGLAHHTGGGEYKQSNVRVVHMRMFVFCVANELESVMAIEHCATAHATPGSGVDPQR
jgi:hypothetical protein